MMNTQSVSNIEDDPTLLAQKQTIDYLKSAKPRNKINQSFSSRLEVDYQRHRANSFLAFESKVMLIGVLIYIVYSWADVTVGGDNGFIIAGARLFIAVLSTLIIVSLMRSKTQNGKLIDLSIAVISVAAFSQVILSSLLIATPMNYVYMVGIIPVQVFVIIAHRLNYRVLILTSFLSTIICVVVLFSDQRNLSQFSLDEYASILIPVFMTFWLILIGMGGYMNFIMESSFRRDYINNRILSLEAERLNYMMKLLKKLSTTDGLTGLINRREFEVSLKHTWQQSQASKQTLNLLMIDVDCFKQYNDSYGHQAGDICLQRIAQALQNACAGTSNICARYGGEEFVVILANMHKQQAFDIAEKIRLAVIAQRIPHAQAPMQVCSVSIGISSNENHHYNTPESLLKKADEKLYKAKELGRNQVIAEL